MSKELVLKPRLSEKAYQLSELRNTYIFDIPAEANRHSVSRAVESQYGVGVIKVRIANIPAKTHRSIRNKGRSVRIFSRTDVRKAYVTLKEGDKLPLFAAVEEGSKPEKEKK
jgi:ribosomal protein L23